jgi:hypothetical protein
MATLCLWTSLCISAARMFRFESIQCRVCEQARATSGHEEPPAKSRTERARHAGPKRFVMPRTLFWLVVLLRRRSADLFQLLAMLGFQNLHHSWDEQRTL